MLCFADFENSLQTTLVINTLQGYRFDKDDIWGLLFSYANKQSNVLQQTQNPNNNNNGNNNPNNNMNNLNMSGGIAGGSAGAGPSSLKGDGGRSEPNQNSNNNNSNLI